VSTAPARVQAVFLSAADLTDPVARSAYLDGACAGDTLLRARVEALLRAHDQPDSLLDVPAVETPDPADGPTRAYREPGAEPGDGPTHTQGTDAADTSDTADALAYLAPAQRPDSLGRIGHYEVLEVLGRGGFGVVFRAFDDVLQRVVAVKALAPSMAVTSPARKRFLREARTSAQVRHENVVQVYEVAEQPLPYLVMEFIPGESLQQRLDRTGPLEVPEVLRVVRQVAEGLAAAHEKGLIHRDIKPANVLIESGPQARAKITDFGLARAADDASLTRSGTVAGTPMYMAPEQARGESLDHRADLFSLGSVMYAILTGRPPFRAENTPAVLKRVADDTPRPIREVIPEVPEWLCRIVGKLHAKSPEERFQTAREVADVLADCEKQLQAHGALKDYSRIPGGNPNPRRIGRKWKWAAAIILVLAAVGAVYAAPFVLGYAFDAGKITLFTDVEKVLVRRDGQIVATLDPDNPSAHLASGEYEFEAVCQEGKDAAEFIFVTRRLFGNPPERNGALGPVFKLTIQRGDVIRLGVFVRERPAPPPELPGTWVPLFNGQNLDGWQTDRPDLWAVKDGELITRVPMGAPDKAASLDTVRTDYRNFHLRLKAKINYGGDSGVSFRHFNKGQFPYHAQIKVGPKWNEVGTLQRGPETLHIVPVTPGALPDTWFTLEVIARGRSVVIKVDGRTLVDWFDVGPDVERYAGPIALETGHPGTELTVKTVEIKELSESSPAVPQRAVDVLPFFAGTWKTERVQIEPKPDPKDARELGESTYEFVADGRFLRARGTTGSSELFLVYALEPATEKFRCWFALTGGTPRGQPATGVFDPAKRTLQWLERLPNGTLIFHEYTFVDPDTITTRLYQQDANNKLLSEVRMRFTRTRSPGAPPGPSTDPQRPEEMKVLDRLIGDWRSEITTTRAAAPAQPKKQAQRTTATPVLGGRMIEVVNTGETGSADYAFVWFEPQTQRYRTWFFRDDGDYFELTGTWDEAAKRLSWTSPDNRLEGHWTFPGADRREHQHLVKSADGKVFSETVIVSVRAAPAPFDAERLLGQWVLAISEIDGKPVPADKLEKFEIHFRGNGEIEFVAPGMSTVRLTGTYEVDPVKKQIRIRFKYVKDPSEPWDFSFDRERLIIDTKTRPPGVEVGTKFRLHFERPAKQPEPAKDGKP
jgi:serine/threonine protein kinase